jgi:hypothetical protein
MRRATGPGKVKIDSLPSQKGGSGFTASLFNFDIDDATVKREHQDFLDSVLVPRLKAAPTPVRLVGSASRTGAADHNRALSEKRVNAVRDHLLRRGVSRALLTTAFTGEDLSVAEGEEDEGDRAVLVVVDGPRNFFPGFDRATPGGKNDGFERRRPFDSSPRLVNVRGIGGKALAPTLELPLPSSVFGASQIVPLNGEGKVVVRNAVGHFVASGDPDVAFVVNPVEPALKHVLVTQNQQEIRIHGVRADDAFIFLNPFPPSRPDEKITNGLAVLEVTVLPPVTIKVLFHFVQGPSGVITARGEDKRTLFLKRLNDVYPPQANITFQFLGAGSTRRPIAGLTSPGVRVDDKKATPDFNLIANARNPGADVNVFFVGKLIIDPPLTGFSTIPPDPALGDFRLSIVDDDADPDDDFVVEHEVCHTLGENHDGSEKTKQPTLIAGGNAETGFIPRAMAKRMHAHLKKFTVR